MWGDFSLLQFYPRNWQAAFFRSMHPWLTYMSLWHFWFWFTFIFVMNLFFIYIFKTLTYYRVDIRSLKSVGDKRRIAWPEMLIILFPIYWAINIITNALFYLRLLESNGGYAFLSVQISAYQWGWKYCYGDTFYPKYFNNSIKVGFNTIMSQGGGVNNIFKNSFENINKSTTLINESLNDDQKLLYLQNDEFLNLQKKNLTETLRYNWNVSIRENQDISAETYFCRWWLKKCGILENEFQNVTKNRLFHSGYWITAQGVDPNTLTWISKNGLKTLVIDQLRLLRSTGALVLPTKNTFRLMSCSEDVTHSWAIPALGIKMDCVPGRLFCFITSIIREGIYFGQCSELCGWNHYNMPVVVYALPIEHFIIWWELELHSIFTKPFTDYPENFIKVNTTYLNYSLLNSKYK